MDARFVCAESCGSCAANVEKVEGHITCWEVAMVILSLGDSHLTGDCSANLERESSPRCECMHSPRRVDLRVR